MKDIAKLLAGVCLCWMFLWTPGTLPVSGEPSQPSAEGRLAVEGRMPLSPHGDLVFRVTGTKTCMDCHTFGSGKGAGANLLDNAAVRGLIEKGKGAHGPGRFADCFRCHAGGRLGVEKY